MRGPGRSDREGMSIVELVRMFPDDDAARHWFETVFWPQGPYCPHCGSFNVQGDVKHPRMTHRCRDCPKRPFFTLKTGTVMEGSPLGYQTWALAVYLLTTGLKGVSSMKLHRDLGVTQKTAWYLAHRIRAAFALEHPRFAGTVEMDETYVGGKKRGGPGRGTVGKAIVAGAKERSSRRVRAGVVPNIKKGTLHGFVGENIREDARIYTDDLGSYRNLPHDHETVAHSAREYVRDDVHTNGIESFWSMLKRAHKGTYHRMSKKHLQRYVDEFVGRHNVRDLDTVDQMRVVVAGMEGKRLRYRDLRGYGP